MAAFLPPRQTFDLQQTVRASSWRHEIKNSTRRGLHRRSELPARQKRCVIHKTNEHQNMSDQQQRHEECWDVPRRTELRHRTGLSQGVEEIDSADSVQ